MDFLGDKTRVGLWNSSSLTKLSATQAPQTKVRIFFSPSSYLWVVSVSLAISCCSESCSLSEWLEGGQPVWLVCVCVMEGWVGGGGGHWWSTLDTARGTVSITWRYLVCLRISDSTGGGKACFLGHILFKMKSIFILHIMTDNSTVDSSWSQFQLNL